MWPLAPSPFMGLWPLPLLGTHAWLTPDAWNRGAFLAIQQDRIPRDLLTAPLLRRGSTQPPLAWLILAVATSRRKEPAPFGVGHC